jgi:hypothetical protein
MGYNFRRLKIYLHRRKCVPGSRLRIPPKVDKYGEIIRLDQKKRPIPTTGYIYIWRLPLTQPGAAGEMVNLDFDIDKYLNPLIPTPWLYRLPKWVSWWFGYRAALPRRVPTVYVWFWTFMGCFCGVSVVQAVFEQCSYFVERNVPGIVGSFVCPPGSFRVCLN